MKGQIGVKSQEFTGSIFWFTIELEKQTQKQKKLIGTKLVKKTDKDDLPMQNILVVEDNATSMMVATTLLSKLGFKPDQAVNGMEALEKLKTQSYDIIFMDCQMPVMDGFEATEKIRMIEEGEEFKTIIIAMTAKAFKRDKQKCLDAGMDDFISKPVIPSKLFEIIKKNIKKSAKNKDNKISKLDIDSTKDLDQKVFDKKEMFKTFANDQESIKSILESFLEESANMIEKIEQAINDGNAKELQYCSHGLKGCSANVHADILHSLALNMENIAKNNSFSQAPLLLEQIKKEYENFSYEIQNIFGQ